MATNAEFMEFAAAQLAHAGKVTYRKMFGEYGVYCDGQFFGTVEDNQLYVKVTAAGRRLLGDPPLAAPHEGARMLLVAGLDDRAFLARLVQETCEALRGGEKG